MIERTGPSHTAPASDLTCPLCDRSMVAHRVRDVYRCPADGTWRSTLDVRINQETARTLDESERSDALHQLREENNRAILDAVGRHVRLPGARLLDVGSAHGWFLAAAEAAGATAEGIEPDEGMAALSAESGAKVRVGYFPAALSAQETFDVIAFNDVLEHLPDVASALADSRSALNPQGILSVNIPNAGGLVYRVANLLTRIGLRGPFERLWQVGLPSPHLWYFEESNLTALAAASGLSLVHSTRLRSMSRQGLWSRVHFDRKVGPLSVATFVALSIAAPVLNARRASDIMLLLFRRSDAGAEG